MNWGEKYFIFILIKSIHLFYYYIGLFILFVESVNVIDSSCADASKNTEHTDIF